MTQAIIPATSRIQCVAPKEKVRGSLTAYEWINTTSCQDVIGDYADRQNIYSAAFSTMGTCGPATYIVLNLDTNKQTRYSVYTKIQCPVMDVTTSNSSTSPGTIAGAVIASIFGITLLIVMGIMIAQRRAKKSFNHVSNESDADYEQRNITLSVEMR